jgi:hypothetical protein
MLHELVAKIAGKPYAVECDLVARSCWPLRRVDLDITAGTVAGFRTGRIGISGGSVSRRRSGSVVAAAWLVDGIVPNGACGCEFGKGQRAWVRCDVRRPKSVSFVRAFTDPVAEKVLAAAHEQAIAATRPGSPGLLGRGGGVVVVADGCGSP